MNNVTIDCTGVTTACTATITNVNNLNFSCDSVSGIPCTLTTTNITNGVLDLIGTDAASTYECAASTNITLYQLTSIINEVLNDCNVTINNNNPTLDDQ
jgi:hypothetical protein